MREAEGTGGTGGNRGQGGPDEDRKEFLSGKRGSGAREDREYERGAGTGCEEPCWAERTDCTLATSSEAPAAACSHGLTAASS